MPDDPKLQRLVEIMDRLREPGGCPWDHEQSYRTLRGYLLEECHEVAEALDREDAPGLCEELGDLLFQIVFLSRIAKEEGRFTIDDVIREISEKMVRRHPHVFGSESARDAEEVLVNWERIKREEKGERGATTSLLDGVPLALPGLLRSQRLGDRAARVGFDWEEPRQVLGKVREELDELSRAIEADDTDSAEEELGDLLFAVAMLGRKLQVDAEGALGRSNVKFYRRFNFIERELERRGVKTDEAGIELMEQLWRQAKDQPAS